MKIQILGSGCPNCLALENNVRKTLTALSLDIPVEKVTGIDEIMNMGVMMTPALAIDGAVKSVGKVLSVEQITRLLDGVR